VVALFPTVQLGTCTSENPGLLLKLTGFANVVPPSVLFVKTIIIVTSIVIADKLKFCLIIFFVIIIAAFTKCLIKEMRGTIPIGFSSVPLVRPGERRLDELVLCILLGL
jgi:hypothetical protein